MKLGVRLPAFGVSIGIATGPVLVGTVGGTQHLTSSIIGEAADLAAPIAALTRGGRARVLIDPATRGDLRDPRSTPRGAVAG